MDFPEYSAIPNSFPPRPYRRLRNLARDPFFLVLRMEYLLRMEVPPTSSFPSFLLSIDKTPRLPVPSSCPRLYFPFFLSSRLFQAA